MWWEEHLLCSVSKCNHHGRSHADKRLCGRKCHKHQMAAVGIILTQHSQGEQNLIFCIQAIWFRSAAGVYLIQQDTWEHTKTLYLGTISCGCFSVKGNKVFHRSQWKIWLAFTETTCSTSQVISISYVQIFSFLQSWGIPGFCYRAASPPFPCVSLYNMSIMNFLALILVSSGSGQTWRCLECDKAVLACQLDSVSKFIFFS